MAKVDLKKSLGYSLLFDEGELIPQDTTFRSIKDYTIDLMREQLLNDELTYPEVVYKKYLGLDNEGLFVSKKLKINEYLIPANLMGIEYVKTKATLLTALPKLLEVHYGGGMLLLQKMVDGIVKDVIVSKLKRNQKIIVPAGYSMTLVNTRQQPPLIVAEIYSADAKNYTALDDAGGMSYYVIRKNAKQEIVKNPSYRSTPPHRSVKWDETVTSMGITLKTPLAKQVLRKYGKFKWLFEENSFEL